MSCIPTGTVYGTLMNFRGEWDALGSRINEAPYKAPPQAPVLYIKPANTFSADGAAIALPSGVKEVEVGATVGMVMQGPGDVAGYVLLNDLCIPHESLFRPPVKFKCLDGFLGVGPAVRAAAGLPDAAAIRLEVRINGALRQSIDFSRLVRPASQLVADVMAFMTLQPGDVLMLGCDLGRPLARAGDRIDISAPGFAALRNTLVAEVAA